MSRTKNPHAVALGRKGGAATKGITSEAKKAATRLNLEKARKAKAAKRLHDDCINAGMIYCSECQAYHTPGWHRPHAR